MPSANNKQIRPSPLIYADSEHNADQLYFGGIFVPDPFISFGIGRKRYAVVNSLEYSRVDGQSAFDHVLHLEEWRGRARKRFRNAGSETGRIIRLLAGEFGIKRFVVPDDFPARLALELLKAKVPFSVSNGPIFPQRQIKSETEVRSIREGNAAAEAGFRAAEKMLRAAVVKKGKLHLRGRALTSELVREAIQIACLQAGAVAKCPIVAGGDQACDPHCSGSGVLHAGELIIIDIFPRVSRTGYFGDMTRTFLKGRATEEQKRLVAAVKEAQTRALEVIKAGVGCAKVHKRVEEVFLQRGFVTGKSNGIYEGFIHGTGHGLGLQIHESPRLGPAGGRLRTGMVVTVEPGLYYRGIGGCRIEDVARVVAGGVELLSKYHYRWQIK